MNSASQKLHKLEQRLNEIEAATAVPNGWPVVIYDSKLSGEELEQWLVRMGYRQRAIEAGISLILIPDNGRTSPDDD